MPFPWIRTTGFSLTGWFFIGISLLGFVASVMNHGLVPIRNHEPLPSWLLGPVGILYGTFFLTLRKYWDRKRIVLLLVCAFVVVAPAYAFCDWLLFGRHVVIL